MAISIEDHIKRAEQRFDELVKQRDAITEELSKLQGEWRLLQELKDEADKKVTKATKQAAEVITAVPEEVK